MKRRFLAVFFIVIFLPGKVCANPFSDIKGLRDVFPMMGMAYVLGLAISKNDTVGLKEYAESYLASQGAVEGLKALRLECRPNGTEWCSFPSGHAAAGFSPAFFAHKRYGLKAAIFPYALAAMTAAQRVFVGAHYTHDVIFGAAIAGLFTYAFVDNYLPNKVDLVINSRKVAIHYETRF